MIKQRHQCTTSSTLLLLRRLSTGSKLGRNLKNRAIFNKLKYSSSSLDDTRTTGNDEATYKWNIHSHSEYQHFLSLINEATTTSKLGETPKFGWRDDKDDNKKRIIPRALMMRSCYRRNNPLLHQIPCLNHSLPSCCHCRSARCPRMSDKMMDRMIKNHTTKKLTRPQLMQKAIGGIRQNANEVKTCMAMKKIHAKDSPSWNFWSMHC